MHEGSVEVTGPGMKAPARVVTGQRLRAKDVTAGEEPSVVVEDATLAVRPVEPPAAVEPPVVEEPAVEAPEAPAVDDKPIVRAIAAERRSAARTRRPAVAAAPTRLAMADSEWRSLEARGRFKEALAAAVREGFEDGCLHMSGADVAKLGETARLAGDTGRAEAAYQAAVRRFPSAPPAQALYGLGKIAFDHHRDYTAAAKWFNQYMQRYPNGALAREAAGLLLVSRIKAGDNAGARAAADSYLRLFKDGPHAKLAHDTVGY
jgi:hypothetical protein